MTTTNLLYYLTSMKLINFFIIFLSTLIDQSFATERLDPPVVFPIYRPPTASVQRYKTSAEHLQRHLSPSSQQNLNETEIEEISTNLNISDPSILESLLGDNNDEEEEKIILKEEEKHKEENSTIFKNFKNDTKIRHLNNSTHNITVINTPQFPLFTGLGMEIIDLPSNDPENERIFDEEKINKNKINKKNKKFFQLFTKNNNKENNLTTTIKTIEDNEEKNNKLNFNISENIKEVENLINITELNKNENTTTINKLESIEDKNVEKVLIMEENETIISTTTTTIEPTTTTTILPIINSTKKIINLKNQKMFEKNKNKEEIITTTLLSINEDFGKPNIRDELDNGFERVTMHLDDLNNNNNIPLSSSFISSSTSSNDLQINNGSIIERPSQTEIINITTTQTILPFNGISFNIPSTETPSKALGQIEDILITSTIMPFNTLNAPSINKNEDFDHLNNQNNQKGIEFPQMNNHLEEGDEMTSNGEEKDKALNTKILNELTTGNDLENKENNLKENSEIDGTLNGNGIMGESSKRTSKFSTSSSSTSSSDSLRIFVLLGIITILLITIAFASIFSARYVKRSRQLHGKYQPAAYEMQTQQRENNNNRYQTSDFGGSTQTSLYRHSQSSPSINNNISQQTQQINNNNIATFGKEERLI